jgi:CubicO group peptidase (beta-lactamase class C family)
MSRLTRVHSSDVRGPDPLRLLPALALLAPGCGPSGSGTPAAEWTYRVPDQVGDGWDTASLDGVGMNPAFLARLMHELQADSGHLVHGILIVRHGRLVFEEYFPGRTHPTFGEEPIVFDRNTRHCLSSVTKSFTATLLGLAIDLGFIGGADESVFAFFPDLQDLNVGGKRSLTLEHLVTMTAGLEWDEQSRSLLDPLNDLIAWLNLVRHTTEDPVRAVLERPMVATPGTLFNYSGGLANVLGKAIQNATGRRLDAFSREHLFAPLAVDEFWWWILRDDFVYASGDIALRPRDLARVGLLYLNGGTWNGRRLLAPEWIAASASVHTPLAEAGNGTAGYGYGWWIKGNEYGRGAYAASGWGGQELIVLPEHDMVVVFTGGSYWRPPLLTPHQMMASYILPSIA